VFVTIDKTQMPTQLNSNTIMLDTTGKMATNCGCYPRKNITFFSMTRFTLKNLQLFHISPTTFFLHTFPKISTYESVGNNDGQYTY